MYREFNELHGQALILQLQLQGITDSLAEKLALFEDNLQQEREKFLKDLCDVEDWLTEVYDVLEKEPRRDHILSYSSEEVRTMQEEYSDNGVINTESGDALGGEVSTEQVKLDTGDTTDGMQMEAVKEFDIHREVSISGSSLGSDILDIGVEAGLLETSVDVGLEDDEYQQQVLDRVLSGSSSPSPSPSALEQPSLFDSSVDPLDDLVDSVDPVGGQWAEMMEEETDFQTETASISSGSTLPEDSRSPEKSSDARRVGTEFSEEEVNLEGVKQESSSSEGGDRDEGGGERGEVGRSLADELGELGIDLEGEFGGGIHSEDSEVEEDDQESGG